MDSEHLDNLVENQDLEVEDGEQSVQTKRERPTVIQEEEQDREIKLFLPGFFDSGFPSAVAVGVMMNGESDDSSNAQLSSSSTPLGYRGESEDFQFDRDMDLTGNDLLP